MNPIAVVQILFATLISFQHFVGKVSGMFKTADYAVYHRIALGLLYVLLFSGLSLMVVGLSITHWIADNMGLKSMLACVMAYIGIMSSLVWAINKINRAFPTLDLPPSSNRLANIWDIEETAIYDESGLTAAVEKSPPIKLAPKLGKPTSL